MGEGGNICTDIPKYRIYRDGKWDGKELTDVSDYWKEGYVGFLIGFSFSFEEPPMRGVSRSATWARTQCTDVQDQYHDRAGRSVLRPYGLLYRPLTPENAKRRMTSPSKCRMSTARPSMGDAAEVGVADVMKPDYGEAVDFYGVRFPCSGPAA